MIQSEQILEFDQIKAMLTENAMSAQAKTILMETGPVLEEELCFKKMAETTSARNILDKCGAPPLPSMSKIEEILSLCHAGSMLTPSQFSSVSSFISSCKRMKEYLNRAASADDRISRYGDGLYDLSPLQEEIELAIRNDQVDSSASTELRNIRRKMENCKIQIQNKLSELLRNRKEFFSDSSVVIRNGRYALPVKKEYKGRFSGSVLDTSSSGNTVFMEPSSVSKLQSELSSLQIEEDNEVRKILYTLSALTDSFREEFKINLECLVTLDVLFAKGKLSVQMKANPVRITTKRHLSIRNGRHPLLDPESCVPLNFQFDQDRTGVVITGPNTGGKTVALKTVGLLSMMAQSGLHVPAEEESVFCMNSSYLCDIGDGQSITENLSTFSAHMTNMIEILREADRESLVLLDELGSGTDPAEGMGIAVAILEELRQIGCLFLVTTHYPEIKHYAQVTPQLVNARMAFDRQSLRPTYHLELGKAGESCALFIAQRLGLPKRLLQIAQKAAYQGENGLSSPSFDFLSSQVSELGSVSPKQPPSKLKAREEKKEAVARRCDRFSIGDSVMVYPKKEIGIVWRKADAKGLVGVQIKGEKKLIPHKRIRLQVPASELYPEDYDFSILFDSVEHRKARHQMTKHHNPNLVIELEKPQGE